MTLNDDGTSSRTHNDICTIYEVELVGSLSTIYGVELVGSLSTIYGVELVGSLSTIIWVQGRNICYGATALNILVKNI